MFFTYQLPIELYNRLSRAWTDLQVDDGAKLAEMFVEFADVVELGGNLPNQQLGVRKEWRSFVKALVVGFVKVWSE